MLIGYMRVSSSDERQSVALQRDALLAAGVDERHLHQDRASGARDDRPGLKACLGELREGDNFTLIGRFAKGNVSCGVGGVIFSNGFEGN